MSPASEILDMETLKVAVSTELYLPYNGILAYQFDLPDDIEHALVAGDVSDRLHAAGGFAVLRPSIAGLSMPRAEHGFGILPTALTASCRAYVSKSCRLQRDMRPHR